MCEIEVACLEYEGIDAIKRALKAGESVSKPNYEVQVPQCHFHQQLNHFLLPPPATWALLQKHTAFLQLAWEQFQPRFFFYFKLNLLNRSPDFHLNNT